MGDREKRDARALQARTAWSYSECLRCVRTMTPDAIEALILARASARPAQVPREVPMRWVEPSEARAVILERRLDALRDGDLERKEVDEG